jgi:hypothetical protein
MIKHLFLIYNIFISNFILNFFLKIYYINMNSISRSMFHFDVSTFTKKKGIWTWWFLLLFIDNEKSKYKKQYMIIISTKNEKSIQCNDYLFKFDHKKITSKSLDGGVAIWYYDGKKMNHNYVVENMPLELTNNSVTGKGNNNYHLSCNKENVYTFQVDNDIHINMVPIPELAHRVNKVFDIIRINRLNISGKFMGDKNITGTAYLQRVTVRTHILPWFWGIFHFENGHVITYFKAFLLGIPMIKNITFYNNENFYSINKKITIKKVGNRYKIRSPNINFDTVPYSKTSWTFRKKKKLGIIPNKLIYREHPAVIENISINIKGKKYNEKNMGSNVGNIEWASGFLAL